MSEQPRMIGRIGSTGNSTGPHLHVELTKPVKPTEPDPTDDPDED